MTQSPVYLLRQIYYFLLERPEINKKSNLENIQEFFFELGLSCMINDHHRIQITHRHHPQSLSINAHELPHFLNEKDFIQWASNVLKQQRAAQV